MAPATKKAVPTTATKPTSKTNVVAGHPSWISMIKECIILNPQEARAGVSRPTIKKFVETKYKIDLNAAAASQLNRAIATGSERGTLILPKGPSGKVKLAPKLRNDAAKENTKPATKKPSGKVTAKPMAKVPTSKKSPRSPTKHASGRPSRTSAAASKSAGTFTKRKMADKRPLRKPEPAKKPRGVKKPVQAKKGSTTRMAARASKKLSAMKQKRNVRKLVSKARPASKAKPASKATKKFTTAK